MRKNSKNLGVDESNRLFCFAKEMEECIDGIFTQLHWTQQQGKTISGVISDSFADLTFYYATETANVYAAIISCATSINFKYQIKFIEHGEQFICVLSQERLLGDIDDYKVLISRDCNKLSLRRNSSIKRNTVFTSATSYFIEETDFDSELTKQKQMFQKFCDIWISKLEIARINIQM